MRRPYLPTSLAAAMAVLPHIASAEKPPQATAVAVTAAGRPSQPLPGLPADTLKRLRSGDSARIQSALDDVRTAGRGGAPAVPAIVDLLKAGLSLAMTKAALETLGDTEAEGASDVVSWYVHHRSAVLRRSAVETLARTRGPAAVRALKDALSDADEGVRGVSATALGNLRAHDAVPDLFAALEHKVPEAAAAIGQLCANDECDRLASKMGSLPFDVVTSGLDEIMLRGVPDVKDDLKVKIVGLVRELGTAEGNRFLKGVQSRWPARASRRVKQAIDQAVLATAASPGSEGTEASGRANTQRGTNTADAATKANRKDHGEER